MPRYFFDVKNGHRVVDRDGLDCRDDREAIEKAGVIARQIEQDAPQSFGRKLAVINSEGQEIGNVAITDSKRGA